MKTKRPSKPIHLKNTFWFQKIVNLSLALSSGIPVIFFIAATTIFTACEGNNAPSGTGRHSTADRHEESLTPYFPTTMHAFIWRNWNLVPIDRMAKILNTNVETVLSEGSSMGLPQYTKPDP